MFWQGGACNEGDVVWFRKDLFSTMPLRNGDPSDPREQVKWIIHERLHAINVGDNPHFFIADITDGIDVLLDLHREQVAGRRPVPTQAQLSKIEILISRIASFNGLTVNGEREEQFLSDWAVWPNGGGLVHTGAQASPLAYIGIGSLLGEGGRMSAGSTLVNSACFVASCELDEGAILENSVISPRASLRSNAPDESGSQWIKAIFKSGARILSSSIAVDLPSSIESSPAIQISARSLIDRSVMSGMTSLAVEEDASLQSIALPINVGDNDSTHLEIGAGASISSLFAPMQTEASADGATRLLSVPKGMKLDFNHKPICAQPQLLPILSGEVMLKSAADMTALCRAPMKSRSLMSGDF